MPPDSLREAKNDHAGIALKRTAGLQARLLLFAGGAPLRAE